MRKIKCFSIITLCSFIICGCNFLGEKVTCTATNEEMGIHENIEVVATINNDLVSNVNATFSFDSEKDMNTICKLMKNLPANDVHFNCSGKTMKIKNFDKMLNFDAKNSTKESFIEKMQQEKFTCN